MRIYEWADKSWGSKPVDAQLVGETIEEITYELGACPPEKFVEKARPEDSPLHGLWDWDRDRAAERWFVEEARRVIRAVKVVEVDPEGEKRKGIAFVSVTVEKDGERIRGYVATEQALADVDLKRQVEEDVLRQLRGLQKRHRELQVFQPVWGAVDIAAAKLAAAWGEVEEEDEE